MTFCSQGYIFEPNRVFTTCSSRNGVLERFGGVKRNSTFHVYLINWNNHIYLELLDNESAGSVFCLYDCFLLCKEWYQVSVECVSSIKYQECVVISILRL